MASTLAHPFSVSRLTILQCASQIQSHYERVRLFRFKAIKLIIVSSLVACPNLCHVVLDQVNAWEQDRDHSRHFSPSPIFSIAKSVRTVELRMCTKKTIKDLLTACAKWRDLRQLSIEMEDMGEDGWKAPTFMFNSNTLALALASRRATVWMGAWYGYASIRSLYTPSCAHVELSGPRNGLESRNGTNIGINRSWKHTATRNPEMDWTFPGSGDSAVSACCTHACAIPRQSNGPDSTSQLCTSLHTMPLNKSCFRRIVCLICLLLSTSHRDGDRLICTSSIPVLPAESSSQKRPSLLHLFDSALNRNDWRSSIFQVTVSAERARLSEPRICFAPRSSVQTADRVTLAVCSLRVRSRCSGP